MPSQPTSDVTARPCTYVGGNYVANLLGVD
jgi:hypothetical protein